MNASLRTDWQAALRNRLFAGWLIFSLITVILLGIFVESYFQNVILHKPGWILNDYVLNHLMPVDWSFEIMTLIYTGLFLSVASNITKPWNFLLAISTYAVITWMRMFSMYLITLEPPVGVIPLSDPLLYRVAYHQSDFVKDLFFSGHMSSMSVYFVVETRRWLRWIFAVMMVTMMLLLLWQHVHYTIDVLAAPIATYVVAWVLRRWYIRKPQTN